MMEFPGLDGTYTIAGLRRHLEKSGIRAETIRRGIRSRHIFSHVEWHLESCELECPERPAGFEWFTLSAPRKDWTETGIAGYAGGTERILGVPTPDQVRFREQRTAQ